MNIIVIFVWNINDMKTKKTIVFPQHKPYLEQMGEQLKLARKRRKLTATQVAERAGISRSTLYLIERGDGGVSMGSYFNVLRTLSLHKDILLLGKDDVYGQKLRDLELL